MSEYWLRFRTADGLIHDEVSPYGKIGGPPSIYKPCRVTPTIVKDGPIDMMEIPTREYRFTKFLQEGDIHMCVYDEQMHWPKARKATLDEKIKAISTEEEYQEILTAVNRYFTRIQKLILHQNF